MKNKLVLTFLLFIQINSFVFAQVRDGQKFDIIKISYYKTEAHKHFNPKLSFGVGVGFSNMYGDFSKTVPAPVMRIGFGCRLSTNVVIDIETYLGQLSSKENQIYWASTNFSERSTFESLDVLAKITLGNYLQYPNGFFLKMLSGIYIGTGVGLLNSNITSFSGRFTQESLNVLLDNGNFTKKSVFTTFIPLNIGLRIPLKKFLGSVRTQFMINYQMNYTFSDFVDGYSYVVNSNNARNQFNDCYTVLTMGLSFHISNN